ncbi:hypothetical protein MNV49_001904 [Pseudohyphozyma bogoriensis]|nr:hypothetical protein MNV49_001904 [Pseudohyphozyma bogoriensis]
MPDPTADPTRMYQTAYAYPTTVPTPGPIPGLTSLSTHTAKILSLSSLLDSFDDPISPFNSSALHDRDGSTSQALLEYNEGVDEPPQKKRKRESSESRGEEREHERDVERASSEIKEGGSRSGLEEALSALEKELEELSEVASNLKLSLVLRRLPEGSSEEASAEDCIQELTRAVDAAQSMMDIPFKYYSARVSFNLSTISAPSDDRSRVLTELDKKTLRTVRHHFRDLRDMYFIILDAAPAL